ncbi:MAG: amidohydrolase [Opitutaceae bacterium]|nr:amidohydrolase [Opitutaceae bacterium]
MTTTLGARKKALVGFIDGIMPEWKDLALRIHDHPELGLQEEKASTWLAQAVERHGFTVTRNVARLKTAFIGSAGRKTARPSIAFLAEYDALPDLGHACSHNLIGAAAGLAAIGVAHVTAGAARIQVVGCPAEEFFGGKARLLKSGVFRGVDVALMAHGYYLTLGMRPAIGRASVIFEFHGKPAYASTVPERGVNALDAMIQTFNNVAMLRQQVRQEARIHGIITDGGRAANVIPDYARAEFYVRSKDTAYLRQLEKKVVACARAAALATGARLDVSSVQCADDRHDDVRSRATRRGARGRIQRGVGGQRCFTIRENVVGLRACTARTRSSPFFPFTRARSASNAAFFFSSPKTAFNLRTSFSER